MTNKKPKLGVIVPHRNRKNHLSIFKTRMKHYLQSNDIPYEIIIVNQDDAKLFNRGALLNIGFIEAEKLECDYVVFHDVDMLPSEVDYSYTTTPIHLATDFIDRNTKEESEMSFIEYFGGVTMFPVEHFRSINGFSNKYWGWGYEDTDLLYRCNINKIELDEFKIKNINPSGNKIKMNGSNAYIKGKNFNNVLNFNTNLTIFISFYPDELVLDFMKEKDQFVIFSIPGYNTELSYNSFLRYNFITFDYENNPVYINTDIKTNYKTTICVTFDADNKRIDMYQDGIHVSEEFYMDEIKSYALEQFFYIGCSINQNKDEDNFFKGYFDQFAIYNKKLELSEIVDISTNESNPLTQNFKSYKSANKLKLYYDTNFIKEYKLVDLSGNGNDGEIFNCEVLDVTLDEYKTIKIPYRRESVFYTMKHEENGFYRNKWKNQATRWNQIKFHNEVKNDPKSTKIDGLSNLLYVIHGKTTNDNVTELNIGI